MRPATTTRRCVDDGPMSDVRSARRRDEFTRSVSSATTDRGDRGGEHQGQHRPQHHLVGDRVDPEVTDHPTGESGEHDRALVVLQRLGDLVELRQQCLRDRDHHEVADAGDRRRSEAAEAVTQLQRHHDGNDHGDHRHQCDGQERPRPLSDGVVVADGRWVRRVDEERHTERGDEAQQADDRGHGTRIRGRPAPPDVGPQHRECDGEKDAHRQREHDGADTGADVLLDRAGEDLGAIAVVTVARRGFQRLFGRAAALVDAWLSVLSSDGYHRDVLDLLKSPFVAGSTGEADRAAGIEAVARLYAHHGLASGLDAVALLAAGDAPAAALVRLLLEARSVFPRTAATPAQWLDRLGAALAALGAVTALASDAAGADILAWIAARRAELADEDARIGFHEWRQWLDRELESVMFRDRSVDSPVVMTHLAAARLRRFEAAALIGADADNLAPQDRRPVFAHEGVRAELGLPGSAQARARLHDDLAGLLTLADAVCISWQHLRDGEAVLPCAAVDVLSLVHQQAFGESLRAPVPRSFEADVPVVGQPVPAPVLMPEQVPTRISASGLASLIACPYRYFARHVLGLGEAEEVSEALEKADYGQMIHAILQAFHARFPQIAAEDDAVLVAALEDESARVFGPALARNFLEHAWAARWRAQLPSYVAWQKAREAEGWTFAAAEESAWRDFALADGARVTLHGRLDRIDRRRDGTEAVLDYKSRPLGALRKQAADADDVQLAVYTLLRGTAVREAAYVALDDGAVGAAPLDDPVAMAEVQAERLVTAFDALHAGAPLPAHGVACGPILIKSRSQSAVICLGVPYTIALVDLDEGVRSLADLRGEPAIGARVTVGFEDRDDDVLPYFEVTP